MLSPTKFHNFISTGTVLGSLRVKRCQKKSENESYSSFAKIVCTKMGHIRTVDKSHNHSALRLIY